MEGRVAVFNGRFRDDLQLRLPWFSWQRDRGLVLVATQAI